jgi:hypothetical protein
MCVSVLEIGGGERGEGGEEKREIEERETM